VRTRAYFENTLGRCRRRSREHLAPKGRSFRDEGLPLGFLVVGKYVCQTLFSSRWALLSDNGCMWVSRLNRVGGAGGWVGIVLLESESEATITPGHLSTLDRCLMSDALQHLDCYADLGR
jgi:hypothetical protein